MDPAQLRTVHVVPVTAFDRHGRLDLDAQARHTAELAAAGVRVFLPAAGTGEFHSLTTDEILDVVRATHEAAGREALVFAPVGGPLAVARTLAERSTDLGVDGIMFMPLAHPYLNDAGAFDYYQAVLESTSLPAVIYKTAAVPGDRLLLDLSAQGRIIAVKYAVNDLPAFAAVAAAGARWCEWLCGSAELFAPYFMLAGATGYTSGAANLCPRLSLAMHAALAEGRFEEGLGYQRMLQPIEAYRAREGGSYGISLLKFGMSLRGRSFGDPRPPQRRLTAKEQDEISELLQPTLARDAELI